MIYIPVKFELLRVNYANRIPNAQDPNTSHLELADLQKFMDSLPQGDTPNTPCCIQVSHALNLAGQTIPATNPAARRINNTAIRVNGVSRNYILAVDELEAWLTLKYGKGLDARGFAACLKPARIRRR